LGINFFDTAAIYGTESIVGEALAGRDRDDFVISTKGSVATGDELVSPDTLVKSLDQSLRDLSVDCIDVYHLHGVAPKAYAYAVDSLVPALLREREKGKFRFLGVTEIPPLDARHESLTPAIKTGWPDVIMIAYHMMHQSARSLLPLTTRQGIGVLIMFAVRVLFSEAGRLKRVVDELVREGQLPAQLEDEAEPLGFLLHEAGARSIIDAAYRYCRHTVGTDVILFGTGNADHLKANIDSILAPALPQGDLAKLEELFGALVDVGLDAPGNLNP
ncbi:MAG: aldo/keto reductase, partial [Gemmatimonadetes bacterium]|nr:aldo/keto reductase [Gemmatimonadota bacterium]